MMVIVAGCRKQDLTSCGHSALGQLQPGRQSVAPMPGELQKFGQADSLDFMRAQSVPLLEGDIR